MKRAKNRKLVLVTLKLNGKGNRIGESHHNAKLADCEVDLLRELHATGEWTVAALALKFGVKKITAYKYISCERRAQIVERTKTIYVPVKARR